MKQKIYRKLSALLLLGLLFDGSSGAKAQCPTGCNDNYGLNSNNVAAEIEYDNIISGASNTIIRETDGTFKVFGYDMANSGNALSPLVINSTNFPGLTGTVLKAAVGGFASGSSSNQSAVLTTSGLYAWGSTGHLFATSIKSTTALGPVTIAGSNSYGLPVGVEPQQVKSLFGSTNTLALLTCSGEAWVLTQNANAAGVGLTTANSIWNRVTTNEAGNPTLNNVVALRGNNGNLMALRADGTLWTWGPSVYLGNGSVSAAQNRAVQMALPSHTGTIKMIGMATGAYYVLYTDGNLFAMGNNSSKLLGDWSTTTRTTWIQPRYTSASGQPMNNIHWISPSEHHSLYNAINVLTTTGQVFNWGNNYQNKLRSGSNNANIDPGTPNTDRMIAIEAGGSSTIVIKACTQNFGFAGNQYYGTMGDGSNSVNVIRVPYNYNTAPVNICGANAMTTASAPVFNVGLPTARCQGIGSDIFSATSNGIGSITYSLSPASAGTINAATGMVTYAPLFTGTATITATATGGCGTPETATHVITVNAMVGTPVFDSTLVTQRCSGAGTVTYTATATAADNITYSISPAAAGTINPTSGEVVWDAAWSGTATITATATGCGSTEVADFAVASDAIFANDDVYTTNQGTMIGFNVLDNDLCNFNAASVEQIGAPSVGILQPLNNGNFQYVPVGNFAGDVTFQYRVASNTSPAVWDTATVTITINSTLQDACAGAANPQVYYMPFPETGTTTFLSKALRSAANINSSHTANARNITSISVTYPGTVIIYDHWEDGYESNTMFPAQSTTQIWGDGDLTNGVAPGYPTDIIPAGGFIELDNSFAWTRPTSTVVFDAKDKIWTSSTVSITKVTGDASTAVFGLQSVKTNVPDASKAGLSFVLPFGEDVRTQVTPNTVVFDYTGVFVQAIEDGTVVTLNYNPANPTAIVTSPVLNQGEVWFYDGTASMPGTSANRNNANDIKKGAVVTSNNPVQVNMVFGGIDGYGTRNIPVYPAEFYGSEYMSPVYSTDASYPAVGYFVNPNANSITINWTRSSGSPLTGSFTVPGNMGVASFNMNVASGTKFESAGEEPYTAVTIVSDGNNTTSSAAFDWAFPMISTHRLTNFGTLGWAPGNSSGSTSVNYQPAWVTAIENARVYVKYDGDITTGPNQITAPGSSQGAYYDTYYDLTALQAQMIFGLNGDNSGMAIFTNDLDPNKLAIAWGERPFGGTPTANPAMDVGYVVEPKCLKKMIVAVDDRAFTAQNTPVNINVAGNDQGYLMTLNPLSVNTDYLQGPSNGIITVNPDGTITYTPNIGFIGYDQFEYRICGAVPDNFTCDVATVYVSVPCDLVPGQNIVKGVAYNDANASGAADPGETGRAGVMMQMFEDINGDGLYNAGDLLLDSVATNSDGTYRFIIDQGFRLIDSFNTDGVGTGNNGTVQWATNWVKSNSGAFTVAPITVTGNKLRVAGNGANSQINVQRTANLSNAVSAMLSYDWVKSQFSSATNTIDFVEVQISATPSVAASWVPLKRYYGIANDAGTDSFDISTFLSATTAIRIMESNNAGFAATEYVEFDNITIKYEIEKNYLIRMSPSNTDDGYLMTEPQGGIHAFNFSGVNQGLCAANFGVKRNTTNAVNDENSTWVNVPVGGDVTTNDFDREGDVQIFGSFLNQDGSGAPITSGTTVSGTDAAGNPVADAGTLTFNPDGTYIYTPATDFTGNISVPYSICDAGMPQACDTAYLDITVSPLPNEANSVIANNDEYYTYGTTPVVSNILINDADPQGDDFEVITFEYDTDGDGIPDATGTLGSSPVTVAGVDEKGNPVTNAGTVTLDANGNLVFTPTAGFSGKVYLDYEIEDDVAAPNTATDKAQIVITVLNDENGSLNDPPFAGDDFAYTELNTPVDGNFIHNDSDPNSNPLSMKDILGNPVTIVPGGPQNPIITVPTEMGGELTFNTDGTYTYTPPTGYTGPDRVVYEICDVTTVEPQPLCAEATIHLLIGKSGFDIEGSVWHDHSNGNAVQDGTENAVSGGNDNNGGTSSTTGGTIYANLVDNATGTVVATTQITPDGSYLFENAKPGNYSVVLTNNAQTPGGTLASGSLPSGWAATGTNVEGTASTGNKTNVINIGQVTEDKDDINFGIQQPPVTQSDNYMINSPAGGSTLLLNGSALTIGGSPVNGTRQSDPEDVNPKSVTITTLPYTTSGTGSPKLFYDGVEITTPGTVLGTPSSPFNPALLSVKFDGLGYNDVSFDFTATDGAGAVSNESTYTLNWSTPVPVSLLSFDAKANGNNVNLTWTTASEYNNKGFEVERSKDVRDWITIGFVNSKADNGNSNVKLDYELVDAGVPAGKYYYRLKQVDHDGKYSYSEVRTAIIAKGAISLYPNPATDMVTVSGLSGDANVAVYDVTGRQMLTAQVKPGSYSINIASLVDGIYEIVIVDYEGTVSTFKVHKK